MTMRRPEGPFPLAKLAHLVYPQNRIWPRMASGS